MYLLCLRERVFVNMSAFPCVCERVCLCERVCWCECECVHVCKRVCPPAAGVSALLVVISSREGNEPGDELTVTYRELLQRVCQFANVLKSRGQSPCRRHGDRSTSVL